MSPARVAAAQELRALGRALLSHDADDGLLDGVRTEAAALRARLEAAPARAPLELDVATAFAGGSRDGEALDAPPDSAVSGRANPLGLGIRLERDGDETLARVRFGPEHGGPPGRVHGAVVAAVFDDLAFATCFVTGRLAYAASLRVSYRAAVPMDVDIEFRVRIVARNGRKLTLTGEATPIGGGAPLADAELLLIEPAAGAG